METFANRIFAADVIKGQPENFTGLEINGVKHTGVKEGDREVVEVNNTDFDFVSAYVRHKDGRALAIADFGAHSEAAAYGRQLAAQYGWTFNDALTS